MKDNGRIRWLMVMGNTFRRTELSMKGFGKMIDNKGKEKKLGLMVPYTLETFS
jgi:hypothetical protein